MPTSKMPTTVNCLRRGITPAGVTMPCGAIERDLVAGQHAERAREVRARARCRTRPARSASSEPTLMCSPRSATFSSCSGRMPRTIAPRTAWPVGEHAPAPARTARWRARADAAPRSSRPAASRRAGCPRPLICTCETTPRMRVAHFLLEAVHHREHHDQRPHADARCRSSRSAELMLMKRLRRRRACSAGRP